MDPRMAKEIIHTIKYSLNFCCTPLGTKVAAIYNIFSVNTHINCIVVRCLINVIKCLNHFMKTLHFSNDGANDA